ncbi:hypothetical protein [Streptomyces buecherae]|uniref:hypothetical protein n=1 Tax=Streptomyces buecherae TaxID=2763006 RepID=UPI0020B71BE6|nr:hypothetical protein [Streptomyces buecherae]
MGTAPHRASAGTAALQSAVPNGRGHGALSRAEEGVQEPQRDVVVRGDGRRGQVRMREVPLDEALDARQQHPVARLRRKLGVGVEVVREDGGGQFHRRRADPLRGHGRQRRPLTQHAAQEVGEHRPRAVRRRHGAHQ